jgi:hypothetical protein
MSDIDPSSAAFRKEAARRALAGVFTELAEKFQPLVDVLGEISDAAHVYTQGDILRLYEIWLKTGSTRARRLLQGLGTPRVCGGASREGKG